MRYPLTDAIRRALAWIGNERRAAKFAMWVHYGLALVWAIGGHWNTAWFCGVAGYFAYCWKDTLDQR